MPMRVHFMGICGSGMSGVAQIAKSYGYDVTGCDIDTQSQYLPKLEASGIPILPYHQGDHLKNIDLLTISPFYLFGEHEEVKAAKGRDMLMTWQEFMGKYLQKDKFVISIAGTHGKSTTTALAGLLLKNANLDPTVEVGAKVKEWEANFQIGKSKYFVCEGDEYNNNFLNYHPDVIILNNIELDHPEYFGTFENMLLSYQKFLANLKPGGTVIYNNDDPGIQKLLNINHSKLNINLVPYSLTEYSQARYPLSIPGRHNESNATAIIKLGQLLNISESTIAKTLKEFSGLARRLELLGEAHRIKIYDDYANLPTAFRLNIEAIKSLYPTSKLWVIIEPHTFSRLRAVLDELPEALKQADELIISQIFASRETDPGDFSGADIADSANHPHARYIPDFDTIVNTLKSETKPTDVILVMGSGNSYKLSAQLVANL